MNTDRLIRASNIRFIAYWSSTATEEERRATKKNQPQAVKDSLATPPVRSVLSSAKASAFFKRSGSGQGLSAAAKALQRAEGQLRPPSDIPAVVEGPATVEKSVEPPSLMDAPSFSLLVGPVALLHDDALQKVMGQVEGEQFVTSHYTHRPPLSPLTRHSHTNRVRIHWQLASIVEGRETGERSGAAVAQDLLPGVHIPSISLLVEVKQAGKHARAEEQPVEEGALHTIPTPGSAITKGDPPVGVEERREALRRRLEALKSAKT